MQKTLARALGTAMLAGGLCWPAARADTVVDFEPAVLTGLYLPGDSFSQGGYTLTVRLDFGVIDIAAALGASSPTGNATQFYFNSNDGALRLERTDLGAFNLGGFAAAFVPLDPASAQTTVIVAVGTTQDNNQVSSWWGFASSATSHFPFAAYSAPATFSNLRQVDFYACSLVGSAVCSQPTQNNGQFAIDDILVSAVPEPASPLLLTLGLLGLGLRARRSAR